MDLYISLTNFPDNCGALNDKHDKRFHQDISVVERRYQGKWNAFMLTHYCLSLLRDLPDEKYRRQAKKRKLEIKDVIFAHCFIVINLIIQYTFCFYYFTRNLYINALHNIMCNV